MNKYNYLVLFLFFFISCSNKNITQNNQQQNTKTENLQDNNTPVPLCKISTIAKHQQLSGNLIKKISSNINNPAAQQWTDAGVDQALYVGDKIKVDKDVNTTIKFESGEIVFINESTELTVTSSGINLIKGEVWINRPMVQEGQEAKQFIINTELGEFKGQGFIGNISYDGTKLLVSVVSGAGRLISSTGETILNPGTQGVLDQTGQPRIMPVKNIIRLASWTENLRRQLDKSIENKYSSTEPAGFGSITARFPGSKNELPFELEEQNINIRIQDAVAITEVEQIFRNPSATVVEGTYRFPLPYGSTINRYAMEINGSLMEGEIVERKKGRWIMNAIEEEFLDSLRPRDPALLEWRSGSTFETKIFPINPHERKRVIISYIQVLQGDNGFFRYSFPFYPGTGKAPIIKNSSIKARISTSSGTPDVTTPLYPAKINSSNQSVEIAFNESQFMPLVDFVIEIAQPQSKELELATFTPGENNNKTNAQKNNEPNLYKNFFVASIAPQIPITETELDGKCDWLILVDTSQSRLNDMDIQRNFVNLFLANISSGDRVKVIAFDTQPDVFNSEWAVLTKTYQDDVDNFLKDIVPAGATNMEGVLREIQSNVEGGRNIRVVLISDGEISLGENSIEQLTSIVNQLHENHGRLITVGFGSSIDNLVLENLANRTGGRFFAVSPGQNLVTAALNIISSVRLPLLEDVSVTFEGVAVSNVYPEKIGNIRNGEELYISGLYEKAGESEIILKGTLNGKAVEKKFKVNLSVGKKANSFIPLLWAQKRIEKLTISGNQESEREIINLSKQYSIPTRYTSFIVLENEAMYREFGVGHNKNRFQWQGDENVEYEDVSDLSALAGPDEPPPQKVTSGSGGSNTGRLNAEENEARSSAVDARSETQKSVKSVARSKSSGEAPSAPYFDSLGDSSGGGYVGYNRHYPSCESHKKINLIKLPPQFSQRNETKLNDLKAQVINEPMSRSKRKAYINHLSNIGRYSEALEETKVWYELDSSNPTVLKLLGDLYRLNGDMETAIRYYSSILDINPENRSIMEMLADYFEMRQNWKLASPFRTSLSLTKVSDLDAKAKRIIALAKIGLYKDAQVLLPDFIVDKNGDNRIKTNINISASTRQTLLDIANNRSLSSLFNTQPSYNSNTTIEMSWRSSDPKAEVQLWVMTPQGKLLGNGAAKGQLVKSFNKEQLRFNIPESYNNPSGMYKIQVFCSDKQYCGTVNGNVTIRINSLQKEVPFVIQNGSGSDVARFRYEVSNICFD